ncbi:MAG: hypothetical protein QF707_07440 [Candidatus Poseidoniaceae archaeon]|jgi:hypothetical protein|nr:hypothetical protein [Candidatus Poseidoniaceae archaeon]MDP7203225.1 hypothetical protein [Candidatus Poseidoniaceae archaeon]|tara:strand:- start:168 stop:449 length:282 start_codon:yes stop_codon:yes gene_type:complete
MGSALSRIIEDESHESLLGGYWVLIRRFVWVMIPILMVFGGIAMKWSSLWIAIIVGVSLGPLMTIERKIIERGQKAEGESNKASTTSRKDKDN